MITESTITCPLCGASKVETMPLSVLFRVRSRNAEVVRKILLSINPMRIYPKDPARIRRAQAQSSGSSSRQATPSLPGWLDIVKLTILVDKRRAATRIQEGSDFASRARSASMILKHCFGAPGFMRIVRK